MSISIILISYNQQQYVFQALESIYAQEENYGRGMEIQLIIADDGSNDNTFRIESEWVTSHRGYFKDIILLPSDLHRGINQNYIRALPYVTEEYFRGLAADDMLADADFLAELTDADLYVFSYFSFSGSHLDYKIDSIKSLYCSYLFWGENYEKIRRYSAIIFPVSLIATVFRKSFINSKLLYSLGQYKYLEDRPIWDCIIENRIMEIKYINIPIVLQRVSTTSISNIESSNEFHKAFLLDRKTYWQRKRCIVKSVADKFFITIYLMQLQFPRFRFLRFFFPYNYLRLYKRISKAMLIRQLACVLDDKYYEGNQEFLRKMESCQKTVNYL